MDQDYRDWIRKQAELIRSDGCTGVLDIHKDCCYEHDLGYYWGRDPRVAYRFNSWELAPQIARGEVDARFRACNGDLMGLWRWLGVRIGGGGIWKRHRAQRP